MGLLLSGTVLPVIGHLLRGWPTEWIEIIALVKGYLIYRLILLTIYKREHLEKLIWLLLIPINIVFVIGILQILNIGDMRTILANIYEGSGVYVQLADTKDIYFRATSTLGHWNSLGSYGVFGAFLSLSILLRHRKKNNLVLLVVTLGSCLGLIILSGSSSSIFGFLIGGIVFWRIHYKRLKVKKILPYLVPVIILGVLVFSLGGLRVLRSQLQRQTSPELLYFRPIDQYVSTYGLPASLAIRGHLAYYLFSVIKTDSIAMITGFGDGTRARDLLSWSTAESGYMSMLFYNGPIYIFLYLLLLWQIIIYARKIKKRLTSEFSLGIALANAVICSTAAMAVINIIASYYTAAGTSHFFWVLVASMMGIIQIPGILQGEFAPVVQENGDG
jgi:hypothetical protein